MVYDADHMGGLSKLEKLHIAGEHAPDIRNEPAGRRIKRVDKDGHVIGDISDVELKQKLRGGRAYCERHSGGHKG
jgi:hypothetical protein